MKVTDLHNAVNEALKPLGYRLYESPELLSFIPIINYDGKPTPYYMLVVVPEDTPDSMTLRSLRDPFTTSAEALEPLLKSGG